MSSNKVCVVHFAVVHFAIFNSGYEKKYDFIDFCHLKVNLSQIYDYVHLNRQL